jgi:hypothetical protein
MSTHNSRVQWYERTSAILVSLRRPLTGQGGTITPLDLAISRSFAAPELSATSPTMSIAFPISRWAGRRRRRGFPLRGAESSAGSRESRITAIMDYEMPHRLTEEGGSDPARPTRIANRASRP